MIAHPPLFDLRHLQINFLAGGNYLLPGIKCRSKTNIPSSKHCLLYNSPVTFVPPVGRFMTKQNSIWSKA